MTIKGYAIQVTTGTTAKGTATYFEPICGQVEEVRIAGASTALTTGGSATLTVTRANDGGTILAVTSVAAPAQWQPRNFVHTVVGVNGTVLAQDGPPVDDNLVFVVTQGGTSVTGTVNFYVETGD